MSIETTETPAAVAFGAPEADAPDISAEETPIVESPEEAASPEDVSEATPAQVKSWHEQVSDFEADPDFVDWREQQEKEARKKGMSDAQSRLQPMIQRYQSLSATAAQGITEMGTLLKKAANQGLLDAETLTEALQPNSAAWQALNNISHEDGTFVGAKGLLYDIAVAADSNEILQTFAPRIDAVRLGDDSRNAVAADLLDAIKADAEKKAEERGYKRGLAEAKKLGSEEAKQGARTGKGPDMAAKNTVGGRSDREKLADPNTSIEEIKAIRDRQKRGS